jgi:hypothetical protein
VKPRASATCQVVPRAGFPSGKWSSGCLAVRCFPGLVSCTKDHRHSQRKRTRPIFWQPPAGVARVVERRVTPKKVAVLDQVLNRKFPGADRISLKLTMDAEISVVSRDEAGVETSSAPVRWSTEPIILTHAICFGRMLVHQPIGSRFRRMRHDQF